MSVCMRGQEASGSVPFCVISNCFQPFSLCSLLRIPFLFKTCRLFQIVCLYMACVCSCVYINDNSVEQRDGTSPPVSLSASPFPPVVSGRSITETCDAEHVCGSCVDVPVGWTHDSSWRMSQHLMLVASITRLLSSSCFFVWVCLPFSLYSGCFHQSVTISDSRLFSQTMLGSLKQRAQIVCCRHKVKGFTYVYRRWSRRSTGISPNLQIITHTLR